MKALVLAGVLILAVASVTAAGTLTDCAGVVRVFGDASSWMSSCFVVGDGSWVVTTADAIIEKAGPETEQTIRYPVFISTYTGQAYQCELKAYNTDLNVAILKLPTKGLPAAQLAQISEYSKAAYGTMGQLMSGDPVGNSWPTQIYGITREKGGQGLKLVVGEWSADKMFVTDIDKYKWAFVSGITPDKAVPNGSMVAREQTVVGMYINKMVITGGKEPVPFGRCAMSNEIARYMGDHGVDTAALYDPPKATITPAPSASSAFQLQTRIYSLLAQGKPELALEAATALAKLWPQDAQAQMVMGQALTGTGKFEDAIKKFDEAAKLDPKLPTLRANRALALVGLNRTSEAEAELLKAIEEAPNDVRPVTAITNFYFGDEKTLDKALTYANKAVSMASNSPAAHLLLAQAQKRLKNYKEATNEIGKALKMAPEWGEAWYALGATCEEGGDKLNAETAYRKLAEKQPKNPDSLLTVASFLADVGKKEDAKEFIGKIRDLKPPKPVLDAAQALEDKINGKKPSEDKPAESKPGEEKPAK